MQPCGNRKLGLSARVFQVHCREGKKRISILAGMWLGRSWDTSILQSLFVSHVTLQGGRDWRDCPAPTAQDRGWAQGPGFGLSALIPLRSCMTLGSLIMYKTETLCLPSQDREMQDFYKDLWGVVPPWYLMAEGLYPKHKNSRYALSGLPAHSLSPGLGFSSLFHSQASDPAGISLEVLSLPILPGLSASSKRFRPAYFSIPGTFW